MDLQTTLALLLGIGIYIAEQIRDYREERAAVKRAEQWRAQ